MRLLPLLFLLGCDQRPPPVHEEAARPMLSEMLGTDADSSEEYYEDRSEGWPSEPGPMPQPPPQRPPAGPVLMRSSESGPLFGPELGPAPEPVTEVLEDATEVASSVDALRCYLLHQREVDEGRAQRGWRQPEMWAYERSEDPCHLLPGFEDPNSVARDGLRNRLDEVQERL